MTAWPGTLPSSLSGDGDYTETPEQVTLRTQMEYGAAVKMRRRQTRGLKIITGSILLTAAQVTIFLTFYSTDIAGGSSSFTGTLTRSGSSETYRFAEDPLISHIGGDIFKLTVKLYVLPT
jgi:hypothetical protein